jgi:uncharacterized protein Usg
MAQGWQLGRQLDGYRLATAEILYHMPDHPSLLQSFVWQHFDLAPDWPELRKFLGFWTSNLDGRLHSVRVTRAELIRPGRWRNVTDELRLH